MTADEELLASSLERLGIVEVNDAELDQRVIRFRSALRRLRTDPAEAARIEALVTDGRISAVGTVTAGRRAGNLTDRASRGRLGREFSPSEETSDVLEDEIVEGEIVDDSSGSEPGLLVPEDTILEPCHHGCTCGLHQQVVYGDRVPRHTASDLDNGEMALLVRAAEDATRLLNDSDDRLRKLRVATVRAHGRACRALRELALLLGSGSVGRARAERDQVQAAYADLSPAERQPAPRWLKAIYNPYRADLRHAERMLARRRKQVTAAADAVADALDVHDLAWRNLRSAQDELTSLVRAELARPWQTVILPARLQHGKAGPTAVRAEYGVKIEILTEGAASGHAQADQVRITYQLFEDILQPQPGPGPLAEVTRVLLDLHPRELREKQRRLEQSLLAQLGGDVGR